MKYGRRNATLEERLTACEVCAYPLSEKHHLLPFAWMGDSPVTFQLCPNCHSLVHIAFDALIHDREHSQLLFRTIVASKQIEEETILGVVRIAWRMVKALQDLNVSIVKDYHSTVDWLMKTLGVDFGLVDIYPEDPDKTVESLRQELGETHFREFRDMLVRNLGD